MHLQARVFWEWSLLSRWKQYLGLLYNEFHLSRIRAKFSHKVVCSLVRGSAVCSSELNKYMEMLLHYKSLWFAVSVRNFSLILEIFKFFLCIIILSYIIITSLDDRTWLVWMNFCSFSCESRASGNSLLSGIVVALVVRRKQASEFVLIRGYTIKQLNTLIVTPII